MKKAKMFLAGLLLCGSLGILTACGTGRVPEGTTPDSMKESSSILDDVSEAGSDIINGVKDGIDDLTGRDSHW